MSQKENGGASSVETALWRLFFLSSLFTLNSSPYTLRSLPQLLRHPRPRRSGGGPHNDAAQHVGGPVHVEVEPGEGDEGGQDCRRLPQGAAGGPQGEHRREGRRRVARGERGVPRRGRSAAPPPCSPRRAAPRSTRGFRSMLHKSRSRSRPKDRDTPRPPLPLQQEQDRRQGDPDLPVVTGPADDGQHRVQKAAAQMGLDPVQHRQFRLKHRLTSSLRPVPDLARVMVRAIVPQTRIVLWHTASSAVPAAGRERIVPKHGTTAAARPLYHIFPTEGNRG